MTTQEILEKLTVILKNSGLLDDGELENITEDTSFDNLHLDSLDQVDLAMSCEEEFGIELDIEQAPKTVGELIKLIKDKTDEEE